MNNLGMQIQTRWRWYGFGLQGREHILLPIARAIVGAGLPLIALLIQLAVFRPGIPGWSGNNTARDLVSLAIFFGLVGTILWQVGIIWIEWLGRGVRYNSQTKELTVYEPTSRGFGGPRTHEFKEGRRQIEKREVRFPWNLLFSLPHIDDPETDQDLTLWRVSHQTQRWFDGLDSVRGTRKDQKDQSDDASGKEKGKKGTSDDEFKLQMLIMLITAFGSESLNRAMAYILSIAASEEHALKRTALHKFLVEAVQKAAMPKARTVDPN